MNFIIFVFGLCLEMYKNLAAYPRHLLTLLLVRYLVSETVVF